MMRRRWRLLANIGLMLISILTALAILEVFVRYRYGDELDAGMYERSRTRSYALKPDYQFHSATGVSNRVNALGLAERDIPLEKESGERRILVIGDSCTHNVDVPYDQRFTTRAAVSLGAICPTRRVTVINGGVSGYNVRQMITLYDEVGSRYDPDTVILHYLMQDSFRRSLVNETFLSFPGWTQDLMIFVFDHSALVRKVRKGLHALTTRDHIKQLGDLDSFRDGAAWRETKEAILTFRDRLAAKDIRFGLMLYTYLHEPETFAPYYGVVRRFAEEQNIPLITTDERFAAAGGDWARFWVSPHDSHPNAAANATIAEALTERLLAPPFSVCATVVVGDVGGTE